MVLVCWDCMSKNPLMFITARAEGRYMLWTWKRIGLRNWRRRLGMICRWSRIKGFWSFQDREIRDDQVVESFGVIYLRDVGRTLRGFGVVEAVGWIEWFVSLEGRARFLGHVSPSWWGSIFYHYRCPLLFRLPESMEGKPEERSW